MHDVLHGPEKTLVYTPAWGASVPTDILFDGFVAPDVEQRLSLFAGPIIGDTSLKVAGRLRAGNGLEGHFLVESAPGRYVFHLKQAGNRADVERSISISRFLVETGAPVIPYECFKGIGVWLVDGLQLTITKYIPARHSLRKVADCRALGESLRQVHAGLAISPFSRETAQAWAQRRNRLLSVQVHLSRFCAKPYHDLIQNACREYDPEFGGENQQTVHGDLSPGNVLFDIRGQAILCDLEDAAFAFHPPIFDVAAAVMRFARSPVGETTTLREAELLNAYGISSKNMDWAIGNWVRHNILVMAEAEISGSRVPPEEWEKFSDMAGCLGL